MDCPKCGIGRLGPITVQVFRRTGQKADVQTIELDQCGACEGVWFDADELETYVKERLTAVDSRSAFAGPPPEEMDAKTINCLRCGKVMSKSKAGLFSGVRMDVCSCGCHWLDAGELDAIEKENTPLLEKLGRAFQGLRDKMK